MSQSIFNGQGVTVNIQIGEKLTVVAVSGTYSIEVLDGVGTGTSLATSATGGTYGPYAYSSVVQLTSSALSEIDYDVGVTTNIVSDTVVRANTDGLTGGIKSWVAGSNVVHAATPGEAFRAMIGSGRKIGVQVYGNSFGASTHSHITRACSASDGRMAVVSNGERAVGGHKTSDIITAMLTYGFESSADVVIIGEGTNDAATGVSNATHIANVKTIFAMVMAAGKIPIWTLTPPSDTGNSGTGNGFALRERYLCELLGIPVYDPYYRYVDTDGTWTAGASADTIHPQPAVYSQAGDDLWSAISTAANQVLLPRSNTGFGIRAANVLQLTDTNADGLPDGWTSLALTGATFALADYAHPFKGKRCSATVGQTATGYLYLQVNSGYSVGDTIRFSGVAGLASASNIRMQIFVRCTGGGIGDKYIYTTATDATETTFERDIVVPSGTTNIQVYIQTDSAAGGAYSGVVKFGCVDFINLSTLGVAVP